MHVRVAYFFMRFGFEATHKGVLREPRTTLKLWKVKYDTLKFPHLIIEVVPMLMKLVQPLPTPK